MTRIKAWLANPWRRPRFLALWAWTYVVWAVGPVIFAIVFTYKGDSDLLIAVTSGMGGSLLIYFGAQLSSAVRERE